MQEKERFIQELFEKGVLVSEDLLEQQLQGSDTELIIGKIKAEGDIIVLNTDYLHVVEQQKSIVDWYEIDKYRVLAEKDRNDELYQHQLQHISRPNLTMQNPDAAQLLQETATPFPSLEDSLQSSFESDMVPEQEMHISLSLQGNAQIQNALVLPSSVIIIVSYENKPYKYEVKDFANIFATRCNFIGGLLRQRSELQGVLSISRLLQKKEREAVSTIGIVDDIAITKNGHLLFSLEDATGKIKVLVSKNNPDLLKTAKDIVMDEVIGVCATSGDKILFADKIVWPDIPSNHELKKSEAKEAAIFLSDLHVGSKMFLKDEFEKLIGWICGDVGNEKQKEQAAMIKYIFIAGDLVDGVGVYPSQEDELEIKDITGQYEELTRYLCRIPQDKTIIVCPGNHDMVHLAEPQPVFYKTYAPSLFAMPNVILVTNPSQINIGKTDSFSGFDVLLYHGYSFDYYVANVESIRSGGGYHRADLIMEFLLKRRHLAPSFRSTPYFPGHKEDPLLIKQVPDFFLTGHIHYSKVANYKNVTMISGSCWQGKTAFQEKLGHQPEPGRVPWVNLQTREIKVIKFM